MPTFVNPNASVPPTVDSTPVATRNHPTPAPGVNFGQTFKPIMAAIPAALQKLPIIGTLFPAKRG